MRPLTATSLALAMCLGGTAAVAPVVSHAQIGFGVSVGVAPPPLPYYDQPPSPGYGYLWTPGYWAWSDYDDDYYWVPGTWVLPPRIGFLWTPPWWGWQDGVYLFNAGYWGPEVGFYGGIDYGYGYTGYGYEGGYWRGHDFFYNRTVNNIRNFNSTNVYERPVRGPGGSNRVSFNGPGGVQARPTNQQIYAARAPHLAPTSVQMQHFQAARTQPDLRASVNHGAPPIAATIRPGSLRGPGVVPVARAGGPYTAQAGAYRPPAGARFGQAPPRYGQAPAGATERFNGGGYNGANRQAVPRYGQAQPGASASYNGGVNGGYRPAPRTADSYGYNSPYRQSAPRYGQAQPSPSERYNGGYNGGYRPQPRQPEAFNGGGGFRQPAPAMQRPPQAFNGGGGFNGGYHPPPRPPEAFNGGGGFRQPAPAVQRAPQQSFSQARPAPQSQPDRNRRDQQPH